MDTKAIQAKTRQILNKTLHPRPIERITLARVPAHGNQST